MEKVEKIRCPKCYNKIKWNQVISHVFKGECSNCGLNFTFIYDRLIADPQTALVSHNIEKKY